MVQLRSKGDYDRMLFDLAPGATVGATLAAKIVVAAKMPHGSCLDLDNHGHMEEVRQVARRLMAQYGEVLSLAQVLGEMGEWKGEPNNRKRPSSRL